MAMTAPSTTTLDPLDPDLDPFDLDVIVVTEVGADTLPVACGTGDGCKPTCASACASAV